MILPCLPALEEFAEDLWGQNPRDPSFDADKDRVSTQFDFLFDTVTASPDSCEQRTHQAPPTLNASKHARRIANGCRQRACLEEAEKRAYRLGNLQAILNQRFSKHRPTIAGTEICRTRDHPGSIRSWCASKDWKSHNDILE